MIFIPKQMEHIRFTITFSGYTFLHFKTDFSLNYTIAKRIKQNTYDFGHILANLQTKGK